MTMTASPPYPAKALANTLLDWSESRGTDVTPLKMQKLLYFMHADYLVKTGCPLVKEAFEAWSYGPVIPSVYEQFKSFSRQKITSKASFFDPRTRQAIFPHLNLAETTESELREIFSIYVDVDAGLLSGISHRANGPWDQALKKFAQHQNINRSIPNDLIRSAHRLASA
jgi:uncharacterized phage-associated protein